MGLFNDGLVSTPEDLLAYEADLKEIAAASGIELNAKATLAQTEVGAQLEASSRKPGNVFFASGAGWQSTGADNAAPRFGLSQVVVTPPLKLWHTFQTLSLVFRDANSAKVSDKYQSKWREYKELSRWAQELLFQTGIGLTLRPVPRPTQPTVSFAASTLLGGSWRVRMTWIGEGGVEGAPSLSRAAQTTDGQTISVEPGSAPAGVSGWNVYVGTATAELTRQNAAPLAPGVPWTLPASGLTAGEALGDGQSPDVYRTAPRFLQRG